MYTQRRLLLVAALTLAVCLAFVAEPAQAYIEIPYTLGRTIQEATFVLTMRVDKVDKQRNLIIYNKVQDIKGVYPTQVIKHNIGQAGFSPREWQTIMAWAEVGKMAVFFHNGSASETCIDNYWYQTNNGGEWWQMTHAEPFFLRTFAGRPDKLAPLVASMVAGQEVVTPCMVDGDKNALQLRTAKVQRLKASLKLQDYNVKRDFVGWGGEDFRRLEGMTPFGQIGGIGRVDPVARGVLVRDFDGDKKPDICLLGHGRTAMLQNGGSIFSEVSLPFAAGTRSGGWADYNGDKKAELLLITPTGPKLLAFEGGKFRDDSARLPLAPYYSLKAGSWIDYDGDGKPDILLADRFGGLQLWRNISAAGAAADAKQFEDVSAKAGLGTGGIAGQTPGDELAVADINGDGREDFYYCAGTGILAINTPQGFVAAKASGLQCAAGHGTPIFGDFDGDKLLDLFVPQEKGSRLYRNLGSNKFVDVTSKTGELAAALSSVRCAAWADFNGDGKLDLFLGCAKTPNRYFENAGDGTFLDRGAQIGFDQRVFNTGGIEVADLNTDGVPDLVLNNEGQEAVVLMGRAADAASKTAGK